MDIKTRFLHGTTYYHFANPAQEHARQFERMQQMGLNAVRVAEIWPGWEVLEPRPGVHDFDELDAYVQGAQAAGLGIIMGVGINNPPPWLFLEFPDARCVDTSGRMAMRRVQSANHDHPGCRAAIERFTETIASRYGAHSGLAAWQLGNEVRYGVERPDNPATHGRFRQWLREQFRDDLDALNRQWGTVYGNWEELYPYASASGAPTEGLSPLLLASTRFMQWSLEDLVRRCADIVRRHSALPVFHNNHGIAGLDYSHWRMAEAGDWAVQDLYPTMGDRPQDTMTLGLDLGSSVAASLGKPYVIGEIGIAQYGTYRRNRPPVELCEAIVMELLAGGARGILYFPHMAPKYEQPHKFTGSQAALRRDGSPNEYARVITGASQFVERFEERLLAAEPVEPRIAAYYGEESLGVAAGYADLQRASMNGVSAMFGRNGLPLRWLDTER
ncbi:beta-galactosidase, partial [Verrucomicrobiota bacterium]